MTRRPDEILLVDDHVPTIRLVTELLETAFPGLAFVSARTAVEAIAFCAASLPRLVIMDIGLPDINGIDATRTIKAMSGTVSIVMHSNHDHDVYRRESAAAGGDAFVSKSQTHADLVSTIAGLLDISPLRRATDRKGQET